MRQFFEENYDMDISTYESGSLLFLNDLHQRANCQTSIFSDSDNYRRIVMVPEKFDPLLEQINLLQTQYLTQNEIGKTER